MRIVADTNTVISGLLWQGAPRRLIDGCRAQKLTLVTSPALLAELAEVLARDKFSARILRAGLSAKTLVEDYADIVHVIEPDALAVPVSRDPDDDQVLACAITAQVDAIVSGDADLGLIREIIAVEHRVAEDQHAKLLSWLACRKIVAAHAIGVDTHPIIEAPHILIGFEEIFDSGMRHR